jgi:Fe2+ or Zn2+ uptake regulation protein
MPKTTPESGFPALAEQKLKSLGLRMTSPRREMLAALAAAERPSRPQEIMDSVASVGGSVDAATVHRFMHVLEELHLVHRIGSTEGWMRCTMGASHGSERGHLLCGSCGRVVEFQVPDYVAAGANEAAAEEGFSAEEVRLEVLGECRKCAAG